MKYIVGLKYTNPAHEHVSLRRRVESRNAVVEASSAEEAVLRASRQQQALGFMVREAGVVKPEINESVQSVSAKDDGVKEEVEQIDEVKAVKAYDKEGKLVGRYRSMDHAKQMKPGHTYKVEEEVESVEEAKKQLKPSYWRAEWRLGTQSEVDKNNKKIFDKLSKTDPVKAAAFHDNLMKLKKKDMKEETVTEAKGEPPAEFMPSDTKLPRIKVPAKPKPGVRKRGPVGSFNKKGFWNPGVRYEEVQIDEVIQGKEYTKQQLVDKMKAGNWETSYDIKPGKHVELTHRSGKKVSVYVKEEVDQVNEAEREAGYKMPDAVRKAQAKFDAQTRQQQMKKVQAGTLAAQRQRELAKKTDEASDPGKTRIVNKKMKTVKAAETMVAKAKGMKNAINMNPSLEIDSGKKV